MSEVQKRCVGVRSKHGEGEVCVREGESEDESRTTVTYVWVVLHVYIWGWSGARMVIGMRGEAKVSDSEAM